MLSITICDDQVLELMHIQRILDDYMRSHPYVNFSLHKFNDGNELLDKIRTGQLSDIYILDVLMPKVGGIAIGEAIRKIDQNAMIIYLTASPQFALDAYGVNAYQYLVKPITRSTLFSVLDKAISIYHATRPKSMAVSTKNGMVTVYLHQIMYAEYDNHIVNFYLNNSSVVTTVQSRESFEEICAPLLNSSNFIRSHRAFIVNLRYVHTLGKDGFCLMGDKFVPISRNNYKSVKEVYLSSLTCSAEK